MQTGRPVPSVHLARDDDDSGHILNLIRAWERYLFHFLNVSESNQFQIPFQDHSDQPPSSYQVLAVFLV
jgi:hypothetical protein